MSENWIDGLLECWMNDKPKYYNNNLKRNYIMEKPYVLDKVE